MLKKAPHMFKDEFLLAFEFHSFLLIHWFAMI